METRRKAKTILSRKKAQFHVSVLCLEGYKFQARQPWLFGHNFVGCTEETRNMCPVLDQSECGSSAARTRQGLRRREFDKTAISLREDMQNTIATTEHVSV